jgi:hypothetical protein
VLRPALRDGWIRLRLRRLSVRLIGVCALREGLNQLGTGAGNASRA